MAADAFLLDRVLGQKVMRRLIGQRSIHSFLGTEGRIKGIGIAHTETHN